MEQFKVFLQSIVQMTDPEFADAILRFRKMTLKKGDYFTQQDKVCKHIAFIFKGVLKSFYTNDKGEEIVSCFCVANSLTTSYKSFIQQAPSTLNIQAMDETELFVIDYDSLQVLYSTSMIWQAIGRAVAEREYLVMEQYASMLNNEAAKEKYVRLLNEQPEILQKASVSDIASYLGVTRRTLSRIRQDLTNSN